MSNGKRILNWLPPPPQALASRPGRLKVVVFPPLPSTCPTQVPWGGVVVTGMGVWLLPRPAGPAWITPSCLGPSLSLACFLGPPCLDDCDAWEVWGRPEEVEHWEPTDLPLTSWVNLRHLVTVLFSPHLKSGHTIPSLWGCCEEK